MAEFLVIRLGTDAGQAVRWIAVDSDGTRRSPPVSGALEDAVNDIGERSVIVLVPAAATLTTAIDIPIRGGARLQAALPFALEEQLAEDVDTLHFAAGTRGSSGLLPVSVVSHEQMRDWTTRLESAGIRPSRMIPENHGLAHIPGTMSMLAAEDQVMFNDGADIDFLMQGVAPSDALTATGALDDTADEDETASDASRPPGHLLVYCEATDEIRFSNDWTLLRDKLASVDINLLPDGVLPRLAVTVGAGAGINLLQGPYGAKTDIGALFRPWRYAAILLLGLGIVGIAGKAADNFRLSREEAALQQQFANECREILPNANCDSADPIAIVTRIRRSIGAPAAPQAFLPSLQQLGLAMQANNGAELEAISYRAGLVDVRLIAPDVATLDSIQKSVSESGRFNASIQSTDQDGDKINSRIQIREGGA